MIKIDDVSIAFGSGANSFRAVDKVSFGVAAGEVFGLVGESGSGKSTLLRAVAGLSPNAEGTIWLNGAVLPNSRPRGSRKSIQMVHQDPYGSLHPNQTVDQALNAPISIHRLGNAGERVAAALAEVGLTSQHRYRYPHQLSGGQRQRVAIARALILEPSILLLDEPTSALDPEMVGEVLEVMTELASQGMTMLCVTHEMGFARRIADRILFMDGGRIIESGTPSQFFEAPRTERARAFLSQLHH